jgi:hypothetical protein
MQRGRLGRPNRTWSYFGLTMRLIDLGVCRDPSRPLGAKSRGPGLNERHHR